MKTFNLPKTFFVSMLVAGLLILLSLPLDPAKAKTSTDHIAKAEKFLAQEKYTKAIKQFRKALKKSDSGSQEAQNIKGKIAIAKTKKKEEGKAERASLHSIYRGGSASTSTASQAPPQQQTSPQPQPQPQQQAPPPAQPPAPLQQQASTCRFQATPSTSDDQLCELDYTQGTQTSGSDDTARLKAALVGLEQAKTTYFTDFKATTDRLSSGGDGEGRYPAGYSIRGKKIRSYIEAMFFASITAQTLTEEEQALNTPADCSGGTGASEAECTASGGAWTPAIIIAEVGSLTATQAQCIRRDGSVSIDAINRDGTACVGSGSFISRGDRFYFKHIKARYEDTDINVYPSASIDNDALKAWAQGFSGEGVKVGVIAWPSLLHGIERKFAVGAVAPLADIAIRFFPDEGEGHFAGGSALAGRLQGVLEIFEGEARNIVAIPYSEERASWGNNQLGYQQHILDSQKYVNRYMLPSKIAGEGGALIQNPKALDKNMLFLFATGNRGVACLDYLKKGALLGGLVDCNVAGTHLLRLRQGFDFGIWIANKLAELERDKTDIENANQEREFAAFLDSLDDEMAWLQSQRAILDSITTLPTEITTLQNEINSSVENANMIRETLLSSSSFAEYQAKLEQIADLDKSIGDKKALLRAKRWELPKARPLATRYNVQAQPNAGDRVLFVGSLTDDGEVADYSLLSENLKGDIILAHDNLYYERRGSTGLAASQVAGAAALLRQKFPNLDGAGIKQVLLQTGDMLAVTDSTKRDAENQGTFNVKILNLLNALTPKVLRLMPDPEPTPTTSITYPHIIQEADFDLTVEENHSFLIAIQHPAIYVGAPRALVINKGIINKGAVCHRILRCGNPIALSVALDHRLRELQLKADNVSVINAPTGRISTLAELNHGIALSIGLNNEVVNYGLIEVSGANASGVCVSPVSTGNVIVNHNTILTKGNGGHGVFLNRVACIKTGQESVGNNNNTIINYGKITTTGAGAHGIYSDTSIQGSIIHIQGSITVKANSNAIRAIDANSQITISGEVSATDAANAYAVYLRGAGSTLTIEPTAQITGGFDLGPEVRFIDKRVAPLCTKQLSIPSTNPETVSVDYGCLTIGKTGSLTIASGLTSAVALSGDNVRFVNHNIMSVTSACTFDSQTGEPTACPHSIFVSGDNANILSTGHISTTQKGSHSVMFQGSQGSTFNNYGEVSTAGAEEGSDEVATNAVHIASSPNTTIINYGGISTTGTGGIFDYAEAIRIANSPNSVITNYGDISTKGAYSQAILSGSNSINIQINHLKGTLTTQGISSHGIESSGAAAIINVAATITTSGATANAIRSVGTGSSITLSNGAVISSATSSTVALYLRNTQTLIILPSVKITGTIDKDRGSTTIDLRVQASLFATSAKGTASTRSNATTALRTAISAYRTARSLTGTVSTTIAATDTGASTLSRAWTAGWTGKDVKVGFVDDTSANRTRTEFVIKSVAPEATVLLATPTGATTLAKLTAATASFAASSSSHNIILFAESLQRNTSGSYATNTAWATLITDSLTSTALYTYMDSSKDITNPALPQASGTHSVNLLLVIPAGDDKTACNTAISSVSIKDCNLVGGILAKKRETEINAGDRVLFVGALTDDDRNSNTADTMASYSLQAGNDFKYDFIVAHDDIHIAGDGARTAYAAARIAGAAALLRHKFPSLDGAALKQVLIQTAKDIGATGADPIFGMGELNLKKALSPIGKMITR